ncbi:unnamed protein product [Diplocarpon coronariae]
MGLSHPQDRAMTRPRRASGMPAWGAGYGGLGDSSMLANPSTEWCEAFAGEIRRRRLAVSSSLVKRSGAADTPAQDRTRPMGLLDSSAPGTGGWMLWDDAQSEMHHGKCHANAMHDAMEPRRGQPAPGRRARWWRGLIGVCRAFFPPRNFSPLASRESVDCAHSSLPPPRILVVTGMYLVATTSLAEAKSSTCLNGRADRGCGGVGRHKVSSPGPGRARRGKERRGRGEETKRNETRGKRGKAEATARQPERRWSRGPRPSSPRKSLPWEERGEATTRGEAGKRRGGESRGARAEGCCGRVWRVDAADVVRAPYSLTGDVVRAPCSRRTADGKWKSNGWRHCPGSAASTWPDDPSRCFIRPGRR